MKVYFFAFLILVFALCSGLFLITCDTGDDEQVPDLDDDDDNGGGVNDDDSGDDDDDDPFFCGKDMDCHDDYLACVFDCDTWSCVVDVCNPDYLDCLSDDGCTEIYMTCKDWCGEDQDCIRDCEDDFAHCFAEYCGGDYDCGTSCFDDFHGCQDNCGDLEIGCHVLCMVDQWDCLEDCLP